VWHNKTASLSGIVSLWDKGQNNLFIHVWVETGPIEMVLTDCNTTLHQHRKWEEDRPHEIALDVTLRTLFTDFEWAYVLPKRSFPCPFTTSFCLEEMRQVSSQVMFLSSEKVKPQFHDQSEFCLIWSYVEHDFILFIFLSCTVSAKWKSSGATKTKHEMEKKQPLTKQVSFYSSLWFCQRFNRLRRIIVVVE